MSVRRQDLLICPVRTFLRVVSTPAWLEEPRDGWRGTASPAEGPLEAGTMPSAAGTGHQLGTAFLVLSSHGLTSVHVPCLLLKTTAGWNSLPNHIEVYIFSRVFANSSRGKETSLMHVDVTWHDKWFAVRLLFSVYSYLAVVSFWFWPWIRMGCVLQ